MKSLPANILHWITTRDRLLTNSLMFRLSSASLDCSTANLLHGDAEIEVVQA